MSPRNDAPINQFIIAIMAFVLVAPAQLLLILPPVVYMNRIMAVAAAILIMLALLLYLWRPRPIWFALWAILFIMIWGLSDWGTAGHWLSSEVRLPILIGAMAGFLAAFVLYVRQRKMVWLGLSLALFLLILSSAGPFERILDRNIVGAQEVPVAQSVFIQTECDPLSVYVNSQLLGQTPLEIRFDRLVSVPPIDPPTQQKRYEVNGVSFYQPATTDQVFALDRQVPTFKGWWTFDNQDHSGYANGKFSPKILFPSTPLHADALLHALEHNNYEPTPEWVNHTRQYLRSLLPELNAAALRDQRYWYALEQVVKAEYNIKENMSQNDIQACWEGILERVDQQGFFKVDTPEWLAIYVLGDSLSTFVEKSFRQELNKREYVGPGWSDGVRRPRLSEFLTPRFIACFFAAGLLKPEGIKGTITYHSLVYGEPFLTLLDNYSGTSTTTNQSTVRFAGRSLSRVRTHIRLNQVINSDIDEILFGHNNYAAPLGWQFPVINVNQIPERGAGIHLQELEAYLQISPDQNLKIREYRQNELLDALGGSSVISSFYALIPASYVLRYDDVPSRHNSPRLLGSPGLSSGPPEPRPDAFDFKTISRIMTVFGPAVTPAINDSLATVLQEDHNKKLALREALANLFQSLLLDKSDVGKTLQDLWQKNTPVIHAKEDPSKDISPRSLIIDAIAAIPRHSQAAEVWIESITTLQDPQERVHAAHALANIHTPEAWSTLEKSAADPNPDVAAAAKKEIESEREQLEKINALIAGYLQPDALLN